MTVKFEWPRQTPTAPGTIVGAPRGSFEVRSKCGSKVVAAIHETAADLYESSRMDKKAMHNFDVLCLKPVPEMTPEETRARAGPGRGKPDCL